MAELEVTERITRAGPQLTAAERRVAQAVLEHPHLVAFGTVADLATQAGAGAATVVRLAAKLGFDGFSALQSSVQDDLSRQLRPAVERIRELADRPHVERHRAIAVTNVTETLDTSAGRASRRSSACSATYADRSSCSPGMPSTAWRCSSSTTSAPCATASARSPATRSPCAASSPPAHRRRRWSSSTSVGYEQWLLDAVAMGRRRRTHDRRLSDGPLSPLAMAAEHSFTLAAHSASPFDSHVGTLGVARTASSPPWPSGCETRRRRVWSRWSRPGRRPARSPTAERGSAYSFVMTEIPRCRWCRRALPERAGRGRPTPVLQPTLPAVGLGVAPTSPRVGLQRRRVGDRASRHSTSCTISSTSWRAQWRTPTPIWPPQTGHRRPPSYGACSTGCSTPPVRWPPAKPPHRQYPPPFRHDEITAVPAAWTRRQVQLRRTSRLLLLLKVVRGPGATGWSFRAIGVSRAAQGVRNTPMTRVTYEGKA